MIIGKMKKVLIKQIKNLQHYETVSKNKNRKRKIIKYFIICKVFLNSQKVLIVRRIMDQIFSRLPGFIIKNYKVLKKILNILEKIFGELTVQRKKWILRQLKRFLIFAGKHYSRRLCEKYIIWVLYAISKKTFIISFFMHQVTKKICYLVEITEE
jgi:hypothetical protein